MSILHSRPAASALVLRCGDAYIRAMAMGRQTPWHEPFRTQTPMVHAILNHIRSSWKENASARQIADLTDQQFADIGGDRLDSRMLDKARRHRVRETVQFHKSVGVFSYPTA